MVRQDSVVRLRPLLRPAQAFREEPSDRLVRAPWLAAACGLAIIAAGGAFGLDALKGIGVVVAFIGGALYTAIQVRAAMRSPEQPPIEPETGTDDDHRTPPGEAGSPRRH